MAGTWSAVYSVVWQVGQNALDGTQISKTKKASEFFSEPKNLFLI
jgi:hypothetical protein